MSPQVMTEKDQFIDAWTREYTTTLKLLRAFPSGKDEFRPAEKSRNARELAWIFLAEEKVLEAASAGELPFMQAPPAPALPVGEIISMFEKSHEDVVNKVRAMAPGRLDQTIKVPVGPKTMADVRVGQVFWMMLMDSIHHRGQLSVYLRLVGAKVPSIYGPTADESWA
ncbi:MAG: DinB family protein [Candidatus Eiseniibacteriota bacterium]